MCEAGPPAAAPTADGVDGVAPAADAPPMNETTRYAVIAALAILAVAFAAATLDSTVESGAGGSDEGQGVGDSGPGGLLPIPSGSLGAEGSTDAWIPRTALRVLLAVAAVAMAIYALFNPREVLAHLLQGVVLGAVLAVLLALVYLFAGGTAGPPAENGSLFGGRAGGGGEVAPLSPPAFVAFLALGVAIAGTALALVWQSSDDDAEPEAVGASEEPRAAALGKAAGRAADRIEADADVDNGVYRAWREMTALLDVDDPASSTAGEFATAAVEAGLGREDVDALTRLFEDVRYGERDPDPDDERRAVATLRRIEERYGEGET